MYRSLICRQLGSFHRSNSHIYRNTSVFVVEKKTSAKDKITYLPEEMMLPNIKEKVIFDFYRNSDYKPLYKIMKGVIEKGTLYPQETMDETHFESYFLSHDVFVLRDKENKEVLASFYIKPNFPGRSSHICNMGIIVHPDYRGKGIGIALGKKYLKIAKDLGYESCLFNIVYATNEASVTACRKVGFKEIGRIPKAGKLKGLGYVDAIMFYYDLTALEINKISS